jgi:hypothetical protein
LIFISNHRVFFGDSPKENGAMGCIDAIEPFQKQYHLLLDLLTVAAFNAEYMAKRGEELKGVTLHCFTSSYQQQIFSSTAVTSRQGLAGILSQATKRSRTDVVLEAAPATKRRLIANLQANLESLRNNFSFTAHGRLASYEAEVRTP